MKSLLPHASPRNLRLFALLGVLVAVMQLNDQLSEASVAESILFWAGRILGLLGCFALAETLVARRFEHRWATPAWLKPVVITTLIAVLPLTLIELTLEALVPQPPEFDDADLAALSPLLAFAAEYATLTSVILPLNLALWLLIDNRQPGREAVPESPAFVNPAFLAKTNAIEVSEVVALEAEEHYVRVHTTGRSELIHHRLGDAASEMPAELGTRVHRSWWVADRYVRCAKRGARRWQLQLGTDLWVPVSDSFVQAARDRGYFRKRADTESA